MYALSFGSWSRAGGSVFIRERVYVSGWRWTPFVRLRIRYAQEGS